MRTKTDCALSILMHYQCIWILLNSVCLALTALLTSSDVAGLLILIANLFAVGAVVTLMSSEAQSSRALGNMGLLLAVAAVALHYIQPNTRPNVLSVATLIHEAWLLILLFAHRRSVVVYK